jgi:radical SAM superfamily enzyme YgiQ (UPF0313 family)
VQAERKRILWCEMPQEYNSEFRAPVAGEGAIPPGSKYVVAALEAAGHTVDVRTWDRIGPPDGHDLVMVALMFCRQLPSLPELFRRLAMEPEAARRHGPPVIVGGHGVHNPVPLARLFDRVVLGDGERIAVDLAADLTAWDHTPHVWPNATGRAVKRSEPCSTMIARQYGKLTSYIEITRGCRSKCGFCELGWTHTYREADREQVLSAIDSCERGRHVHLLGPDAASWPHYSEAIGRIRERGLVCTYNSMRVDTSEHQTATADTCRHGIEGVSERLRKRLLKPYSTERIRERLLSLNAAGVHGIKLFLLWGLPWTQRCDYDELWTMLNRLHLPGGGKITLKLTGIIPQPGTPFEHMPQRLNVDEYGYLQGIIAGGVHVNTAHSHLTSVHILPVQSLGRQAWETYLTRAGAEMWDVLCAVERERVSWRTTVQIRALAMRCGVPWDEVMAGRILGQPVEPVRPLPEITDWEPFGAWRS